MTSTRSSTSSGKRKESPSSEVPEPKAPRLTACPLFQKESKVENKEEVLSQGLAKCSLFGSTEKTRITIDKLQLGNNANLFIVGRVSHRSDVHNWNKGNRSGRTVQFQVLDATGEISVTIFNEKIEEVFDLVKLNNVIDVSGFRASSVEEKFRKLPNQNLELIMSPNGSVQSSEAQVPEISFSFQDIISIDAQPDGTILDFVGTVYAEEGLVEGIGKNGHDYQFKMLNVTDKTKFTYTVKLWGHDATDFILGEPVTIILRRAKVNEYEGVKTIGVTPNTLFMVDSDIPEAKAMKLWFEEERLNS